MAQEVGGRGLGAAGGVDLVLSVCLLVRRLPLPYRSQIGLDRVGALDGVGLGSRGGVFVGGEVVVEAETAVVVEVEGEGVAEKGVVIEGDSVVLVEVMSVGGVLGGEAFSVLAPLRHLPNLCHIGRGRVVVLVLGSGGRGEVVGVVEVDAGGGVEEVEVEREVEVVGILALALLFLRRPPQYCQIDDGQDLSVRASGGDRGEVGGVALVLCGSGVVVASGVVVVGEAEKKGDSDGGGAWCFCQYSLAKACLLLFVHGVGFFFFFLGFLVVTGWPFF